MYLVPLDKKLLMQMKKAQQNLDDSVVFFDNDYIYHMSGSNPSSVHNIPSDAPHHKAPKNYSYALDHLVKFDLVRHIAGPCYRVTYDGWTNYSIHVHEVLSIVVTHVLFPSIVALITTILALLIRA